MIRIVLDLNCTWLSPSVAQDSVSSPSTIALTCAGSVFINWISTLCTCASRLANCVARVAGVETGVVLGTMGVFIEGAHATRNSRTRVIGDIVCMNFFVILLTLSEHLAW